MPEHDTSYISWYSTDATDTNWRVNDTGTASNTVETDVNPWVMPVAEATRATIRLATRVQAPEWGRVRYSVRGWYEDVPESLEEIEHKADWEV